MHLSLLLSIASATASTYAAAVGYTSTIQSLDKSLADAGLQSYAKDANLTKGWTQATRCEVACDILSTVFRTAVSNRSSTSYVSESSSYWAQQQSTIAPACYVLAKSAQDVSTVVTVSRLTLCPFAVKSGGHSDVPYASNIAGGVTLDLAQMNSVQVASDKKTTAVGTGAKWATVYSQLETMGLMVVGGRVSSVGVGGLVLGGGMSYFSARYGFSSDNVAMFEVVMADGRISNVTYASNPDLFFALRGGANNFGIVTKFHLQTYPQGLMWGGVRVYPATANRTLSKAVASYLNKASTDPDSAIIASYSHSAGQFASSCIFDYAKPQANPTIYSDFLPLNNQTLVDTTRIASLTNLTDELSSTNPRGLRQRFMTATFKNNAALQSQIVDITASEINAALGSISDKTSLSAVTSFEPIFNAPADVFTKNGGDAFSAPTDGPYMFLLFSWTWASAADDKFVLGAVENIYSRSVAAAKQMGLYNAYAYLNDAGPDQAVFQGYGAGNLQRLRDISKKYDPEGVFQKLLPGGFKLGFY